MMNAQKQTACIVTKNPMGHIILIDSYFAIKWLVRIISGINVEQKNSSKPEETNVTQYCQNSSIFTYT